MCGGVGVVGDFNVAIFCYFLPHPLCHNPCKYVAYDLIQDMNGKENET